MPTYLNQETQNKIPLGTGRQKDENFSYYDSESNDLISLEECKIHELNSDGLH